MRRTARPRSETGLEKISFDGIPSLEEFARSVERRLLDDLRTSAASIEPSTDDVEESLERLRSLRREAQSVSGRGRNVELLEKYSTARDYLHRTIPGLVSTVAIPEQWIIPDFAHLYCTLESAAADLGKARESAGFLVSDPVTVLGVTSAIAGEGKTTVALNLALSAAQNTYKRVCLIDLTLGKGDLGIRLGIGSLSDGVVDRIEGSSQTMTRYQVEGCEEFVVIPAGREPRNPGKAARSLRVGELFDIAREMYDLVLVDLPPLSEEYTSPLTRHLDGVIMVVCAGVTPRDLVSRALDKVGREGVVGVVLNRVPPPPGLPWHSRHR